MPPIGKTVGIVEMNRPGIYEFSDNKTKISDIFSIAGANFSSREFCKRVTEDLTDTVDLNLKNNDFYFEQRFNFHYSKRNVIIWTCKCSGISENSFFISIEKYSSISKIIPNEKFLREDAYKFAFI